MCYFCIDPKVLQEKMERYNHPPFFGPPPPPPPKGQQNPKPAFHKVPDQHYNITIAGWSKQIENQWRACVQIGLYLHGSNCLFLFLNACTEPSAMYEYCVLHILITSH